MVTTTYSDNNPSDVDTFMSIYTYPVYTGGTEHYCNSDSLSYTKLTSQSSTIQSTIPRSSYEEYICVLHSNDCSPSLATNIFTCKQPPKSSISSIFIFLPALLFFIFFLAIIIRLIRRNAYRTSEEDPTPQPQSTILQTPRSDYELSNVAAGAPGGYPLIQMTNQNGQTFFVPQFPAPSAQMYTNQEMPHVVYVTNPNGAGGSSLPPVYMVTNPMPPQY
jgi:hypothetical protein